MTCTLSFQHYILGKISEFQIKSISDKLLRCIRGHFSGISFAWKTNTATYFSIAIWQSKTSSYIAQYPVLRTIQSALHFTSLTDLFTQTPLRLLWEASSHMLQLMREGCSYTYPPLSIVRYSFIQLSEPNILTPQHRIRTRVLVVESPKLYHWVIALYATQGRYTISTGIFCTDVIKSVQFIKNTFPAHGFTFLVKCFLLQCYLCFYSPSLGQSVSPFNRQ